jgi:hypothetical protein
MVTLRRERASPKGKIEEEELSLFGHRSGLDHRSGGVAHGLMRSVGEPFSLSWVETKSSDLSKR